MHRTLALLLATSRFFVFFTGVLGLIVYVLARTKGNLVVCPSCRNKRLETSVRCPHCGNE